MSDRPDRSYWGFGASFLQSIFALLALLASGLATFLAGAFNFGHGPFRTENALRVGAFLVLPVALIVLSAVLLWLRNRRGWFLTILINGLIELMMSALLIEEIKAAQNTPWRHISGLLIGFQILVLLPIMMLLDPETRRDFLEQPSLASPLEEKATTHHI